MALRHIPLDTMITRSKPWLDPQSSAHALLAEIPAAQAHLVHTLQPCVEALAHLPRAAEPDAVAPLTEALSVLDRAHDDTAKGVKRVLEGLALLATDPARREHMEGLAALLFPRGLKASTSTTYAAEAGAGVRLSNDLTDERAQALAALPLPAPEGGDLLAAVRRWIALAAQLGEVEAQRAATARDRTEPTRQEVLSARLAWVNAVKTLKLLVKQAKPSREGWAAIFGDLERDERAYPRG